MHYSFLFLFNYDDLVQECLSTSILGTIAHKGTTKKIKGERWGFSYMTIEKVIITCLKAALL